MDKQHSPLPASAKKKDEAGGILSVEIQKTIAEFFSGPIPPPETLKIYEEIYPGITEILLRQAEEEQKLRGRLQEQALANDRLKILVSIIPMATTSTLAALSIIYGHPVAALPFGLSGFILALLRFWRNETPPSKKVGDAEE